MRIAERAPDRESFDPNKVIDFWIRKSNEVLNECKHGTEFTIREVKIPIIQRVVDIEKDDAIVNDLELFSPLTPEEIEDSNISLEAVEK